MITHLTVIEKWKCLVLLSDKGANLSSAQLNIEEPMLTSASATEDKDMKCNERSHITNLQASADISLILLICFIISL